MAPRDHSGAGGLRASAARGVKHKGLGSKALSQKADALNAGEPLTHSRRLDREPQPPTGVFVPSLVNLDFRAEGTENELGVYGYGAKGMRVYDFGWVQATRTRGKRSVSTMRLQMHSTDPRLLGQGLGTAQSLSCTRIPGSLNAFIDRHGILDADYEQGIAAGRRFWVLRRSRSPTPWSGRYLVIVDSLRKTRPVWSPGAPTG